MKFKPLVSLVCTVGLLTGCSLDSSSPTSWIGTGAVQANKMAITNADIIAELIVLNKAEISAAQVAKKHATNSKVRRYAAYLLAQHSSALHQTLALSHKSGIAPHMNTVALTMQRQSAEELAQLKSLDRHDFDKAYINAMIQGHQNALKLIDNDMAQSTNPALTSLLKATRQHVAMHLQKAEHIHHEFKY